ncbi:MAG: hypothetical protein GWN58_14590, partial [Anaerolineae bacterium]|nr:hypothetical protein [Anaerolineae bacterium]
VRHILSDSDSVAVITAGKMMGYDYSLMIDALRPELPELQHMIVKGEGGSEKAIPLAELLATDPATPGTELAGPDDLA